MNKSKQILKNKANNRARINSIARDNAEFMKNQILYEKERQTTIKLEARVTAKAIVDEAMPNLRRLAREEVLRFYMTIVAFALHEANGFGKKRLDNFVSMFCRLEYIMKDNMYKDGDVFRLEEMYQTLKDETGFDMFEAIKRYSNKYKIDDKNGTWKAYDLPDRKTAG